MYYRFNERHRIEFSTFSMDRDGTKILELEVDIEDQTFSIGEQLTSDISYELYRLGYSYSFFHSDKVELAVSVGLNITKYEFDFENADGTKTSKSDATAPLPMFGLRVGYAINSNWSMHYLAESFFIEIEDTYKGSLLNNEVNLQYRFPRPIFLLAPGLPTSVPIWMRVTATGKAGSWIAIAATCYLPAFIFSNC